MITDPVFATELSGVVQRLVEPGIDLEAIPAIDLVLVSHPHRDHLDFPSIERLHASAMLLPTRAIEYLPSRLRTASVRELGPWAATEVAGLKVTAVPSRHSGGRFGLDSAWNQAHCGFVIEGEGVTVYFAGDTRYDPDLFREIGRRFKIDLALIPVGPAGQPEVAGFILRRVHATPEQAMQIFEDLQARYMIPIHFGTFFFRSAAEEHRIREAIARSGYKDRVLMLAVGQSVGIPLP